ncbi:EEF1A lysine methyltransferase 4 [Cladobotryum mycophilum]|uniref:EEF1A lysine methyltransferase 4 n=1 Tax=Cladobotryum mycophilum TaxID=491253 RepID=A0ABR0SVQ0_9HYPO
MAASDNKALGSSSYWDSRYAHSDGQSPTHEWFLSFSQLEGFFRQNLFQVQGLRPVNNPLILHLGSGDSVIPKEFASQGYCQQLCVDFSPVVVNVMSERHGDIKGIEWKEMDVRDMSAVADKSISVAFNKGTLDAMIHGSPWNPQMRSSKTLVDISERVLKDDGVFLYITFRQSHFIKPLLNPDQLWDIDMQVLGEDGSIPYFAFVLKKRPVPSPSQTSDECRIQ